VAVGETGVYVSVGGTGVLVGVSWAGVGLGKEVGGTTCPVGIVSVTGTPGVEGALHDDKIINTKARIRVLI
jgi:hypothetical protein